MMISKDGCVRSKLREVIQERRTGCVLRALVNGNHVSVKHAINMHDCVLLQTMMNVCEILVSLGPE